MLTKNVNETVKKKGRLGRFLIDSGQIGKSIYTAICLVQYWLQLKVDGTALKLTASKVRALKFESHSSFFGPVISLNWVLIAHVVLW